MGNDRKVIAGFDGIRGIAASTVALAHFGLYGIVGAPYWLYEHFGGRLAVNAFFILSGYLITYLLLCERQTSGAIRLGNFWARRFLRILPLYMLVVAIVTVLATAGLTQADSEALTFAWLYIYNFLTLRHESHVLAHTWSLAVEEHFYLIWPLLLVALSRVPLRKVAVGVALFAAICPMMYLFSDLSQRGFFVHRLTVPAAGAIAMGAVFGVLFFLRSTGRIDATESAMRRSLLLGTACVMILSPVLVPLVTGSWKLDQLARYSQILGVALLIDDVARHQKSLAVRFLELAPLRYLGMVSYGIYMWQGLFLGDTWLHEDGYIWPPHRLIGLAALVVVVPVSYHFFEKPLLAMKEKFRGGSKTSVLAQPSRLY
jgi:peptidoglycan/LPS O-acetylase OafA/YrhL